MRSSRPVRREVQPHQVSGRDAPVWEAGRKPKRRTLGGGGRGQRRGAAVGWESSAGPPGREDARDMLLAQTAQLR